MEQGRELVPSHPERDISKTISKLRLLAPMKMRRIEKIEQERARLFDVLERDTEQHFLGADRFARILDYNGTEGKIVNEVLDGAIGTNPVTGNLWADVLLDIATRVDIARRSQIYANLLDTREEKFFARKRIDRVIKVLEQTDHDISKRAVDENFYRENILKIIKEGLEDTFSKMFKI